MADAERPGVQEAGTSGSAGPKTPEGPVSSTTAPARRLRRTPVRRGPGVSTGIVAAGTVLLIVLVVAVVLLRKPPQVEPPIAAPVIVDTTRVRAPAAPRIVLPDTMVFYVVATGGPLDPVRVRTDGGIRRPYWIERGDSVRFEAVQQFAIRSSKFHLMRVMLLGRPYEPLPQDTLLIITRDTAQAFLERVTR